MSYQEDAMKIFNGKAAVLAAGLVALLLCGGQLAWADKVNGVHIVDDESGSRFIAGCPASVTQPVAGDLVVAGCEVDVQGEIGGDLVVMGGDLRVRAPVKGDVYAAGGQVIVEAPVQGSLRVAGGKMKLAKDAKVSGSVTVGGGEVEVDGTIVGSLQVGGGHVHIDGTINGDVDAGAGVIDLGSNAHIDGRLTYKGKGVINRDAGSQVLGGIEHSDDREDSHSWRGWRDGHDWNTWKHRDRHWPEHGWGLSLALLLIAAILAAVAPNFYSAAAESARTRWPLAAVIGFVVLVCTPVAIVVTAITIIGIPLAVLLAMLYFLTLLAGSVSTGIVLGEVLLTRWRADRAAILGWRVGAAVLATLVLNVLGHVPLIGWLVSFMVLITGIGVLAMQIRRSPPTPAAPAI
jgi:cytoskeletal protein CcmA (bactofilin family)